MTTDRVVGSTWGKWDLHIHTPSSWLNQQFEGDWNAYLEQLTSHDSVVFGITNYFCFAENELERVRRGLTDLGANKIILGDLEFRFSQPNRNGEFINAHVLFSERLSTEDINSRLSRLRLINSGGAADGGAIYCCSSDIGRLASGFESALVDFSVLTDFLSENFDARDYLLGSCPSGYGAFRPSPNEGRGAALAAEIDKRCQFLFGSKTDRSFFLKEDRYPGAIAKPVYAGSDAHKLGEIGRRFCWVKATPEFEGLIYTLFEPEHRISLDSNSPAASHPKPYFSSIKCNGAVFDGEELTYAKQELLLNDGLVAIIGGRGSGKSTILDCLYRQFNHGGATDQLLQKLNPMEFSVRYVKQDGEEAIDFNNPTKGELSYLHVRQGEIKAIVGDARRLSDEIRKLLGLMSPHSVPVTSSLMRNTLRQYAETRQWLEEADENGNLVNTLPFNQASLAANEARLKTLSSSKNRDLLERFNVVTSRKAELYAVLNRIPSLEAILESFKSEFAREISQFNELNFLHSKIPSLQFNEQHDAVRLVKAEIRQALNDALGEEKEIRLELARGGIEQDPEGLLDKATVFQGAATAAGQKIEAIESKQQQRSELLSRRGQLVRERLDALEAERVRVGEAFAALKRGKQGWTELQTELVRRLLEDISIEGKISFDVEQFYGGMAQMLDMRKFRGAASVSEKLAVRIGVSDYDSFRRMLNGEAMVPGDDGRLMNIDEFCACTEYFSSVGGDELLEYVFLPERQLKYLNVIASMTYKRKEPAKLSVGQRGTFYVCMKLATDPFGSPFVFDQPEDDLDNDFVVSDLVPIFREVKKYRQVLIATHNANLVVNADAEQVIVASNESETLSYCSGGLEGRVIRDAVCNILEGGREAFLKREGKYGLTRGTQ